jgi:hypothetical protein
VVSPDVTVLVVVYVVGMVRVSLTVLVWVDVSRAVEVVFETNVEVV